MVAKLPITELKSIVLTNSLSIFSKADQPVCFVTLYYFAIVFNLLKFVELAFCCSNSDSLG